MHSKNRIFPLQNLLKRGSSQKYQSLPPDLSILMPPNNPRIYQSRENQNYSIQILNYDRKPIIRQIYTGKMARKLLKKGETPDQFQTQLYDKITKIEAQVLQRIQRLKTNTKSYLCQHFTLTSPDCQPYNPNTNYYDKFWKRFLLNEIGKQNLLQFKEQLDTFSRKLSKVQSLYEQWQKQLEPIMKTKRKNAKVEESERFTCQTCGKGYRDEETLMLHAKIKHKGRAEDGEGRKDKRGEEIYEEENEDQ